MTDEILASGAPRSAIWRRQAEEIVRNHSDFCVGHFTDEAWCSCAPLGQPLCPACSKLADAIEAALRACPEALAPSPDKALTIPATDSEREQVELAASLRGQTAEEYITRAINAAMRKQGVDAVLFKESDDE
jgi:hypothetical protein